MNEFARSLIGLIVGGLLVGSGSVAACQLMAPTPKFCFVWFFFTAPYGCFLGFIVGLFSSLGRKPRPPSN